MGLKNYKDWTDPVTNMNGFGYEIEPKQCR
jgi:hypothetical protein